MVQLTDSTRQLARIGFAREAGFLKGGVDCWGIEGRGIASWETILACSLAERLDADDLPPVVDVGEAAEWRAGHDYRATLLIAPVTTDSSLPATAGKAHGSF